MKGHRPPAVSGMFYPSEKQYLSVLLDKLFSGVESGNEFEYIPGIIVPHAGYRYSGATAATGFSAIKNHRYENVVILSPSHYDAFYGCSIYPGTAYSTPLGLVPINTTLVKRLTSFSSEIMLSELGHRDEHGVEVELPFLQHVWGEFNFVPVVMGSQDEQTIRNLSAALTECCDPEKTLLVVSSDLSHFHHSKKANILDAEVSKSIEDFDDVGLMNKLQSGLAEACGGGLIVSQLRALKHNNLNARVLHRTHSGEISGDNNSVVGYLTAVLYGTKTSL